jgi:preprotein translocase subunit SecG
MIQVFYFIHVLICIALVIVVLLQSGKGAGMASVFGAGGGGGGGETLFGSKGFGGMLAKATGVLAVAFMVSSISLSLIPMRRTVSRGSVLDRIEGPVQEATEQRDMPVQPPSDQAPPAADVPAETPDEQPAQAPSGGE